MREDMGLLEIIGVISGVLIIVWLFQAIKQNKQQKQRLQAQEQEEVLYVFEE